MPPHPFTLDQYAVLELANDARRRESWKYGANQAPWSPYLSSFEAQFGFRPNQAQLERFGARIRNNPGFYHNCGQSYIPRITNPDAAWAEYERYWNYQGYYNR